MADNNTLPNDGFIARFFQRDSDTLAGWDNVGVLMYKIFHEWGDSYDPATGQTGRILGEKYDAATGSFVPDCTVGEPVYNGRLSGLWECVSRAWGSDLGTMWRAMRAAGLNFDYVWGLYQKFRTQWCEALYAADAMGYANTGRFDMAYGDKSEAMRHILKARFRYLDSKYGADTSTPFVMSLSGAGKGVALRYYCPLYGSLNWGSAAASEPKRAITPGEAVYFPSPGVTFNDTTFTLYNADLITEISTYAEQPDGSKVEGGLQDVATTLYIRTGENNLRRLKSLVLDYSDRAANTSLGSNVLAIAKNSVAMRRFTVRNCPNVTGDAEFISQVIEEIDLRGTGVGKVTVPDTDTLTAIRLSKPRELRYENLGGLAELTVEDTSALAVMVLKGCPKLNYRGLLKTALAGDTLQLVELDGVNFTDFTAKQIGKLADMGAKLSGTITFPASEKMTFALKQKCIKAWGDIDSADNALRITYSKVAVDYVRIAGAGYFSEPGKAYQLTVISDNPNANDFTSIEWEMEANPYATIDTATGVVTLASVGTEEASPTAQVTVRVHRADGSLLERSTTVGFYARTPRIGDYIYADGTISNIRDESRTHVATLWRIVVRNGRTYRFGFAPKAISGNVAWGAESQLSAIPTSDVMMADIQGIPNCSFTASAPAGDTLWDEEAEEWKTYKETELLRNGLCEADTDAQNYSEGDIIPLGMRETWKIIKTRNEVLRHDTVQLPQPVAHDGISELDDLKDLITEANKTPGNAYRYYYPAASYAYAYEPTGLKEGEILAECFKAHRWFLPTPGDMQMMLYSLLEKDADAYASAVANGDIALTGYAHTTGEHSSHPYCAKVIALSRNFAFGDYNTLQLKSGANSLVFPMITM
ncbi:MAG: Ig-like domain-containing protein [Muribaculaceae bacterium]|nr:Ig-like domain-containing protein [Muribaculaceae bacterium]